MEPACGTESLGAGPGDGMDTAILGCPAAEEEAVEETKKKCGSILRSFLGLPPQAGGGRVRCTQASLAPRAAAPPRAAQGPTPRTEEAAWAATALTFLLVLLTLATLGTWLHRNFRRGESVYWGPAADSQDTVAAVLKRRLLMPPRPGKRSRRRPLLLATPDSGPDGDSSD